MTEPETTLISACCDGPYRPIGQFRVIRRIWNRKFDAPLKAGRCFTQLTFFYKFSPNV